MVDGVMDGWITCHEGSNNITDDGWRESTDSTSNFPTLMMYSWIMVTALKYAGFMVGNAELGNRHGVMNGWYGRRI